MVGRDLGLSEAAVRSVSELPRGCALWVIGQKVRIVQHVMTEYERSLVLTDDARLPEQDPQFDRVKVFKDHLVFHYRGDPTSLLAV